MRVKSKIFGTGAVAVNFLNNISGYGPGVDIFLIFLEGVDFAPTSAPPFRGVVCTDGDMIGFLVTDPFPVSFEGSNEHLKLWLGFWCQ